ncbi:MAG TPA: LPXTG cell wall anchor domain-containing protein [Candidatus Paceibacterota bacterium]
MKVLTYLIICGNILFVLWMVYNGIDEGFTGSTGPQIASYIGLTLLLILNSALLLRKK